MKVKRNTMRYASLLGFVRMEKIHGGGLVD